MSRSVNTPSNAVVACYVEYGAEQDYAEESWDDFLDFVRDLVKERYPSFNDADYWFGQEEHVVLTNDHGAVVVCGYGNVASVSLVPFAREWNEKRPLAVAWCNQVAHNFAENVNRLAGGLRRIGVMSNGESVYTRAS